jgi:hypothetical protein
VSGCAPRSLSAGAFTAPRLSISFRMPAHCDHCWLRFGMRCESRERWIGDLLLQRPGQFGASFANKRCSAACVCRLWTHDAAAQRSAYVSSDGKTVTSSVQCPETAIDKRSRSLSGQTRKDQSAKPRRHPSPITNAPVKYRPREAVARVRGLAAKSNVCTPRPPTSRSAKAPTAACCSASAACSLAATAMKQKW